MRYAIWDKESTVYTPSGAVFTAEEWKVQYPIANIPTVKIVCGGGVLNGSFFGIFEDMVNGYRSRGCDFSDCESDEDYLEAIEEFEDAMNAPDPNYVSTEERIAAALEAQVMMSLPDDMWDEELTEEE